MVPLRSPWRGSKDSAGRHARRWRSPRQAEIARHHTGKNAMTTARVTPNRVSGHESAVLRCRIWREGTAGGHSLSDRTPPLPRYTPHNRGCARTASTLPPCAVSGLAGEGLWLGRRERAGLVAELDGFDYEQEDGDNQVATQAQHGELGGGGPFDRLEQGQRRHPPVHPLAGGHRGARVRRARRAAAPGEP